MHAPPIGGVLHVDRLEGPGLVRRWLWADVSTHDIGSRETTFAVGLHGRLLMPSQHGRSLTTVNPAWDH